MNLGILLLFLNMVLITHLINLEWGRLWLNTEDPRLYFTNEDYEMTSNGNYYGFIWSKNQERKIHFWIYLWWIAVTSEHSSKRHSWVINYFWKSEWNLLIQLWSSWILVMLLWMTTLMTWMNYTVSNFSLQNIGK